MKRINKRLGLSLIFNGWVMLFMAQSVIPFVYQKEAQTYQGSMTVAFFPEEIDSLLVSQFPHSIEVELADLQWDAKDSFSHLNSMTLKPSVTGGAVFEGRRLQRLTDKGLNLSWEVSEPGAGQLVLVFEIRQKEAENHRLLGKGFEKFSFRVFRDDPSVTPSSIPQLPSADSPQVQPDKQVDTPATFDSATHSQVQTNVPLSPELPDEEGLNFVLWGLLAAVLAGASIWGLLARKKRKSRELPSHAPKANVPSGASQETSVPPAEPTSPPQYAKSFTEVLNSNLYYRYDLPLSWANTVVTEVYMHRRFVAGLNQFIRSENERFFGQDEIDQIPEIGGFMMGLFRKIPGGESYQVALEWFVPTEAEANDAFKVEFGKQAWYALTHAQDMLPDLYTIGWFHTHPGHGLFLSEPDLRIHNHFFTKPYQLAMEIDSHTPALDTAFFSRKADGSVNNRSDLNHGSQWLSWVEVDKWTRKTLKS